MSLLFKNLRVHQIFGANTDVGKTILTSALVRASAVKERPAYYLKPVSTGPPEDADDQNLKRFCGVHATNVHSSCLFRFQDPVSPHLAVRLARERTGSEVAAPTDETFVNSVANHIRQCAIGHDGFAHMYIETAGGVHSPTLSGTSQLDSYRPLFLPTILIGDSKLGGISSTISSYESVLLRGYIVDGVLLFRDEYYRNWEYLKSYFSERNIHVQVIDPPPPRQSDPQLELQSTEEYYQQIVSPSGDSAIFETLAHLDARHSERVSELESMPRRTLDTIWWPFVQHGLVKGEQDVNIIDSAWGDFFTTTYSGHHEVESSSSRSKNASILEPQFDGSASWWTQTIGHGHPALSLAAARAAGRYGHVMFPQASHLPALKLAERLVHQGPGKGWASRAFFSDNGSTGMEVALKMALRAFTKRNKDVLIPHQNHKLGILGLKGSYHGDTIGAMDACETSVYTCEWHESKGYWFDPPTLSIRNGEVIVSLPPAIEKLETQASASSSVTSRTLSSLASAYNVEERLQTSLASTYSVYIKRTLTKLLESNGPRFAALVLEPIVMGAGGMVFVDPLFQRVLVDVVRGTQASGPPRPPSQWSGLPVIFDEVFVGLYRLGLESCSPLLGVYPDVSVNAKMLTGGLMPLAVTMASDSIFQAFLSEEKTDALLHGHSYTAYPVACEVANETLDIMKKLSESEHWASAKEKWGACGKEGAVVWSFWDPNFVDALSKLDSVDEVMAFGTVLAIKVHDDAGGYGSHSAQKMLQSLKVPEVNGKLSSAPGGGSFSIHYRTLGDVAYFMLSVNTPSSHIHALEDRIWHVLKESR